MESNKNRVRVAPDAVLEDDLAACGSSPEDSLNRSAAPAAALIARRLASAVIAVDPATIAPLALVFEVAR
jgi:hypothetical protein